MISKKLQKLLKKYDIPFEIRNGELYLYPDSPFKHWEKPTTEREAYRTINAVRNRTTTWRTEAKKVQNRRIRHHPIDDEVGPKHKPDRWMWD